jgi:hypothetical protein
MSTIMEQMQEVIVEKHNVIRNLDAGLIDKHAANKRLEECKKRIDDLTKLRINELMLEQKVKEEKASIVVNQVDDDWKAIKAEKREERKQAMKNKQTNKEEKKMPDEENVKQVATKVKKEKKPSYAALIIKALQMKSIKGVEATADKVNEWLPGRDRKKMVLQVKTIIYLVKKGAGRWSKYCWDEENFLLTEKQVKPNC